MIGHYLDSALRNIRRNPLTAAIKMLALSLGLVCLLTAHMIGAHFAGADAHWENAGRIQVLGQEIQTPDGDSQTGFFVETSSRALSERLRLDFPELVVTRTGYTSSTPVRVGDETSSRSVLPVDPYFLDVFDLTPVRGRLSLDAPDRVLVSEEMADALFSGADPIGQPITLGADTDVIVGGVYAAFPQPSQFDAPGILIPDAVNDRLTRARQIASAEAMGREPPPEPDPNSPTNWMATSSTTYVLFPEDGSMRPGQLAERLDAFAARHVPPELGTATFRLTPLTAIEEARFTRTQFGEGMGRSITRILYIFGALTLVVACLDFANLSVAEALRRSREIGLRKTLGASRGQVAALTMVETALIALAALAAALPLAALIAPTLGRAFYVTIPLSVLLEPRMWLGVAAILAGVVLMAGAYPAGVLAGLRPVFALRMGGMRGGAAWTRALLVGAQFAVSGFLIVLVLVMLAQRADLRSTAKPDGDPVVSLTRFYNPERAFQSDGFNTDTLIAELQAHPAIRGVATMGLSPFIRVGGAVQNFTVSEDPGAPRVQAQTRNTGAGFFAAAGVEILAGREFDAALDNETTQSIVIDELTSEMLGFTPQEAVGRTIHVARNAAYGPPRPGPDGEPPRMDRTIIGVAEHTPLETLTYGPRNYIYSMTGGATSFDGASLIVRVAGDRLEDGLAHIDATLERLYEPDTMDRRFLDEMFDQTFRTFNMLNTVMIALACIAVAIAAMGLFGMASFIVQRRLREIGVRKTLGASGGRVLALMLWDFSKPVIVANLVAWPFAFVAARMYLNVFVTRIPLSPWLFAASLAIGLTIAWIAVSVHAVRAARVKPAMVLKTE